MRLCGKNHIPPDSEGVKQYAIALVILTTYKHHIMFAYTQYLLPDEVMAEETTNLSHLHWSLVVGVKVAFQLLHTELVQVAFIELSAARTSGSSQQTILLSAVYCPTEQSN